jgi:hypothetical protein
VLFLHLSPTAAVERGYITAYIFGLQMFLGLADFTTMTISITCVVIKDQNNIREGISLLKASTLTYSVLYGPSQHDTQTTN